MKDLKVAIIGLGYVGLPLAVAASKNFPVLGFDIHQKRIDELNKCYDRTDELDTSDLKAATNLTYSSDPGHLQDANFYVVTVPTPIDDNNKPDLSLIKKASVLVGQYLVPGDIVVYESTVYPGCTEEDCVPILERESGLTYNEQFFCGYSPERINPGDRKRRIHNITKVTSGSTAEIAKVVDQFYASFISAGTHKASSIKVAEAAKVIENAQRDINIAFVNELSMIFNKMGLNTNEVLAAAGTKWNFLNFAPGLVGGHCIGVDPYYLTHKAADLGHEAEIILAGRRINDNMSEFVAGEVLKMVASGGKETKYTKVLVLGITFKENCPDIRNSKVVDLIDSLKDLNFEVDVHDPLADKEEVKDAYGIDLTDEVQNVYGAFVLAVAHQQFKDLPWRKLKQQALVYDIKGFLPRDIIDASL